MKKYLITILFPVTFLITSAQTGKVTFPDGVRHGTIFETDEKTLQNLLKNGQVR